MGRQSAEQSALASLVCSATPRHTTTLRLDAPRFDKWKGRGGGGGSPGWARDRNRDLITGRCAPLVWDGMGCDVSSARRAPRRPAPRTLSETQTRDRGWSGVGWGALILHFVYVEVGIIVHFFSNAHSY